MLWVPPFLSYELWKQRIELAKLAIQTALSLPYISWAETFDLIFFFLLPVSPFHANVGVALESMFVRRNQHTFLMGIPYALGFLCR